MELVAGRAGCNAFRLRVFSLDALFGFVVGVALEVATLQWISASDWFWIAVGPP
jgi:hypothetical protein